MRIDPLGLSTRMHHPDIASLLLRLFFGGVLVYGTQDNVLHTQRMLEFTDFLASNGFPVPLLSAYVSAYAQFICGLLILVGAATRYAALAMVVNFLVALTMVHVRLPFSANIAPLAMLFCAIFFVLNGPGRFSVDAEPGAEAARSRAPLRGMAHSAPVAVGEEHTPRASV